MSLQKLTDQNLLSTTKALVQKEKRLTAKILDHFDEIDRRKLYSDLYYHSLFEYAVKELNYSEDQAYRRINAMRLSRRIPLVKQKVETGQLTLSNANLLSGFLGSVKDLSKKEESAIVSEISETSKRQCQDILNGHLKERGITPPKRKESIVDAGVSDVRMCVTISKKTLGKINELKALYGHKNIKLDQLMDLMADALLDQKKRERTPQRKIQDKKLSCDTKVRNMDNNHGNCDGKDNEKSHLLQIKTNRRPYISKSIRFEVFEKYKNKCALCDSKYYLEIDHIIPYATGGSSQVENLRILCRNCNQREGVKLFGVDKMTAPGRVKVEHRPAV